MKKYIIFLVISLGVLITLTSCGIKQNNKNTGASENNSSINNVPSREQGVDEIDGEIKEENTPEIDFETGKIISSGSSESNVNNSSTPSNKEDGPSETFSSSDSSIDSSNSTSSNKSSNDTMSGWQPLE